jgi:hypothetical protein
MNCVQATFRLMATIWACGAAAGLSLAQTPAVPTPSNVPKQSPPTGGSGPATGPEVAVPTGAVDLRPKFRTGQVIKYVFDQAAKSSVKSQDPSDTMLDQDQKQAQRLRLSMKVVQAGDDGATIQVVYDSIKVTLTTPDGVAEYDSTKPTTKPNSKPIGGQPAPSSKTPAKSQPFTRPGSPATSPNATPTTNPGGADPLKDIADMDMNGMLGLMVGPMVGTTITVKTDRTGAITSVTGGEALGGSMGGAAGLGGMGGMGGSLVPSPSAVANWLVSGLGGPGNKGYARVGESWTNNDSLSGTPVGAFSMKTTHTLKSASGGSANVAFVGGIEPTSSSAAPGGGGGIGQVQSASYTGSYVWDTRSGALAEMGTDMRVVLDASAAGTKVRMTSETQVKVRRQ